MRSIDADALKEKYTMVTKRYGGGIMERPAVLLETIDEAPTIDRPSGEWIDRGMRVPSSWVKKCSLCGHETDTWRWCKFCPNCGAKMVKDDE